MIRNKENRLALDEMVVALETGQNTFDGTCEMLEIYPDETEPVLELNRTSVWKSEWTLVET